MSRRLDGDSDESVQELIDRHVHPLGLLDHLRV